MRDPVIDLAACPATDALSRVRGSERQPPYRDPSFDDRRDVRQGSHFVGCEEHRSCQKPMTVLGRQHAPHVVRDISAVPDAMQHLRAAESRNLVVGQPLSDELAAEAQ